MERCRFACILGNCHKRCIYPASTSALPTRFIKKLTARLKKLAKTKPKTYTLLERQTIAAECLVIASLHTVNTLLPSYDSLPLLDIYRCIFGLPNIC